MTGTTEPSNTTEPTETTTVATPAAAGTALPAELSRAYRPADVEGPIYERWLAADVFAPDGAGSRADESMEPFVIIQPPPNVTGSLHLGHAQRSTVEDLMIRHARMQGRPTLWLPGLDHASIAAQYVLDRIIAASGDTRQSLGRERYLERMWEFIEETRGVMLLQQRHVGASLDWSRLRFTMDEVSARAVREAFTRLYRDGLAYRTEALVNWCPGCRTSVSDLEVIPTEQVGTLWTVRYHFARDDGSPDPEATISVATTRPETILGDTAVAVHPDDPRYSDAIGRTVIIPFVDRPVPVIADEVVDPAFGTGAVKITPAHDPDDYATAKRHDLPFINVMNDDGTMNEVAAAFAGMDRYEARNEILARLQASGDLVESKPHEMLIGRCQRSNDVIEPRLKTQWFIRTTPLAAQALEATRSGRTTILPPRFVKVWEHWLTNIRDWNVSRQLWWGHRIPAWYCPDAHATVTADPAGPAACEVCGRPASELTQDPDIFDTWFSSGLWPFSTLGWPEPTPDLNRFYPGSVMETAYDIIFFWVARMMMLGLQLTGEAPFHTVYLSGLVRDPYGQKMSKTKGNVVDPLETIGEFGADALRFALVNGTAPGNDLRLGRDKLENGRNFANKLWNAARYVLGARPESVAADAGWQAPVAEHLGPTERWIRSRTAAAVAEVSRHIDDFAFGEATRVLYEAIWSEFCDWGLELAKVRLGDSSLPAEELEATWWTLVESLDTYLRLLHPVMPFVTEAIWAAEPHAPDDPELLIVARWPAAGRRDKVLESEVDAVLDLVRGIRNARAEAGVEPGSWLPVEVDVPPALAPTFAALRAAIERLARARPLTSRGPALEGDALAAGPGLAVAAGGFEAIVGRGVIGGGLSPAERTRLERELADAQRQLEAIRSRLADPAFVAKAPPAIVDGARERESELAADAERLRTRLAT
ncbi:MAG TPA: valine--tRNA ligase [Candidatus Limnocylindrales bacterium]